MAPFSMERVGSGIIFNGSGIREVPRPVQLGQAPSGLFREKWRGVKAGEGDPVCGSVGWVEKERSSSGRICAKSGVVHATITFP
jgi:hypothetical protein